MEEFSTLLQEIQFSERFRGYDPDEVDAYVHTIAKAAAQMKGRLTELQTRVEAAESRLNTGGAGGETAETLTRTLLLAQRTADAAMAEAEADAARMIADAEERSSAALSESEEHSAVLLSAAQSQAAALMADADSAASARLRDAQDRSSRILAEAETDRRRIVADAEFEAASAATSERDLVLAEVTDLESRRDVLRRDMADLDHQVGEQRTQLQRALSALRLLIEDPSNFGQSDAAVEVVSVGEPEVVSVGEPEVVSVSEPEVVSVGEPEIDSVGEPEVVSVGEPEVVDLTAPAAPVEVDPIIEEFGGESPAPAQASGVPVDSLRLIDDFVYPDITVGDLEEKPEMIPPAPSYEVDSSTGTPDADEAGEAPVDAEIDLLPELPADAEIDLLSETPVDAEIDLLSEAPVDVEIVPDATPPSPPATSSPSGDTVLETVVDAEVRTTPPRFVTVADLDEYADESGEMVDEGSEMGDEELITQPVPAVEPEHPSLFTSEDSADDTFLAQLREAVSSDDQPLPDEAADEALSAFFAGDDEERERGWFGKKH